MENKRVTNTAKFILGVWNIGMFALIWCGFYNSYAFQTFRIYGGFFSLLLYTYIYSSLCRLYKASRIASSEIGATVFSQVLSFGIADLILYSLCCLIHNDYVIIFPGAGIALIQILGTMVIVTCTKQYLIRFVPPKKTIILYGKDITPQEAEEFKERLLKKYSHLFEVVLLACEKPLEAWDDCECAEYDVAILYELSADIRGRYMYRLMEEKKTFYISPRIEDIMFHSCEPKHLLDTPLMKYDYKYENRGSYAAKRLLDVTLSLFVLVLFSPVLLLVALLIKIEDGGPVFFKQKRCTKDARVFEILKFRSMVVDAEKNGVTPCMENDDRITKIGRVIRRYRLDEFPQLINVLKGDMSIVGPRPERIEHVEEYTKEIPEFAYRLKVLGGLTGYAQIYGKYNTSAYDKIRLDLLYIENQSLVQDLKLILLTIRTVFSPESTEGFEEEKSREMKEKARQQIGLSMVGK